ncbi:unnamed protein product [Wuchereria bancrofti]|nr:unnamed protein product [Wuchereria bancrofti]
MNDVQKYDVPSTTIKSGAIDDDDDAIMETNRNYSTVNALNTASSSSDISIGKANRRHRKSRVVANLGYNK